MDKVDINGQIWTNVDKVDFIGQTHWQDGKKVIDLPPKHKSECVGRGIVSSHHPPAEDVKKEERRLAKKTKKMLKNEGK